jgi:hypothetical protein
MKLIEKVNITKTGIKNKNYIQHCVKIIATLWDGNASYTNRCVQYKNKSIILNET